MPLILSTTAPVQVNLVTPKLEQDMSDQVKTKLERMVDGKPRSSHDQYWWTDIKHQQMSQGEDPIQEAVLKLVEQRETINLTDDDQQVGREEEIHVV